MDPKRVEATEACWAEVVREEEEKEAVAKAEAARAVGARVAEGRAVLVRVG